MFELQCVVFVYVLTVYNFLSFHIKYQLVQYVKVSVGAVYKVSINAIY